MKMAQREESRNGPQSLLEEGISAASAAIVSHGLSAEYPTLVAVVGGSATGKTSVVVPRLQEYYPDAVTLCEDDYCIGEDESARLHGGKADLYVADDYDPSAIVRDLKLLKAGKDIVVPRYSFELKERLSATRTVEPSGVVIMDGCYLLQNHSCDLFDVKLFVDSDDHTRFIRHFLRPRRNSAQSDAQRLAEYCLRSYRCYYTEIEPYKRNSDILIANPFVCEQVDKAKLAIPGLYSAGPIGDAVPYRHPAMKQTEILTFQRYDDGIQELRYTPDIRDPSRGAVYRVAREVYEIDLRSIGYKATHC